MNNTNFKYWHEFSLDCNILNKDSLQINLRTFWKAIMMKQDKGQVVNLILKVKFTDGSYASLSHLQSINNTMFQELLETLNTYLDLKAENYTDKTFSQLIFKYHICTVDSSRKLKTKLTLSNKVIEIPSFSFSGYSLPLTTNVEEWGRIMFKTDNSFVISSKSILYSILRFSDKQIVKVKSRGKVLFEFTDIFGDNPTSFTRNLKNQEYVFKDGSLVLKKLVRKTEFITKTKVNKTINSKFLTLDIETRTIDNLMIPYCVSIYDGSKFKSFYLSDYKDSDEMLVTAIYYLLRRSYNGYKVYIHNLSHFDGIFLFRILSNIENSMFKPIMKDGKMITLKLSWRPSKNSNEIYSIDFKDSLLMLPNSLRKLAKAFNVEDKGIFPYSFVNTVDLDYVGSVPAFNFFDKIGINEYKSYKANWASQNNTWNLRDETIKYCELDCRVLWNILDKFNELIFDKYSLNIHRFPTLPSLAFGIFRCHYLIENQIPKISGQMYHDIKKGYTGGHTDVYKPVVPKGVKIKCYDVNSLYPFSMKSYPMPIGNITYFDGDILQIDSSAFGFFEVEVTTPTNLDKPLLQTKVLTKSGIRTIAPLGSWTDMVFSEEMNEYMKYGYSFKVIRGYLFDQGFIFEDYVQDLFKIKQSESIGSPMYLISKLLLNSLYGRFGMSPYLIDNSVLENSGLEEFINKTEFKIIDCLDLNNGKTLVSYQSSEDLTSLESNANVNISIAAAITSYARIYMTPFLAKLNVYYTDTDSIYTDDELDPKFIGSELGQFKLEGVFDKAVFLAPKVYGGILEDGREITKVKGFKNALPFSELESLLIKDSKLELKQDKWFKSISKGNISIKTNIYTLVATENKRKLFNENNQILNTKPFIITSDKTFIKK